LTYSGPGPADEATTDEVEKPASDVIAGVAGLTFEESLESPELHEAFLKK
jgi:hypothetical protein